MFAPVSKKFAAAALAATCALTMTLSAGTAQAKGKDHQLPLIVGGAIVGGALLGGLLSNNSGPAYGGEVYAEPRECWRERQFVGYSSSGRKIFRRVTVCD
jgi:hypothetical protein